MHKSDSTEQRDAEKYVLQSLETELGATFNPAARLPIASGVQPDAIDPVTKIIVEVYARVGPVKGAQLHKIKGDVLKLAFIGQQAGSEWRRVLCFASEEAAAYVTGKPGLFNAHKQVQDIAVIDWNQSDHASPDPLLGCAGPSSRTGTAL